MGAATARAAFESPARPCLWLVSEDPAGNGDKGRDKDQLLGAGDDLPYKVELWDERGEAVERALGVMVDGTIGYAAYYAAIREYPNRKITLRYKHQILSRSTYRSTS